MANLIGNPRLSRKTRWVLGIFYVLLVIGGLSMVYPFWLMVTGSITGGLDFRDRALVPRYLTNRDELFTRYLTDRYPDPRLLGYVYELSGLLRPADLRGRVRAPRATPSANAIADWHRYLAEQLPVFRRVIADPDRVTLLYQQYLEATFRSSIALHAIDSERWQTLPPIERLNDAYRLSEPAFSLIRLPPWRSGQTLPVDTPLYRDFALFLKTLPPEYFLPAPPSEGWDPLAHWRGYLAQTYGTADQLAQHWNAPGLTPASAPLLYQQQDAALFIENEAQLRWRMLTQNYVSVARFLFEQGYAARNTVILVAASIIVTLVLNPLAAYGLSRYPGRHGKVTLLIMVMTIAFPAEVAMIPSFLLLRDLDLLNTFAALILPGAVSGFSIFLLKGFFDGLPEELFDAATIDGANGMQIFWNVALPLSRPILAVIALGTFTAVYGGYMWALLVCQDPRMWTLMVWLFQFQINFSEQPWLGMAAFVIASIPTLLVFLFCQRLILRGIIIPTEK